MKVELTISRVGFNFVQNAGDIIEVSSNEADSLIESGAAIPVRSVKKETAVKVSKKEKAAKK
tara:strand:+ start:208 stop:393 length:186 start_codon:yes stop_codon:yes gene_type:complete